MEKLSDKLNNIIFQWIDGVPSDLLLPIVDEIAKKEELIGILQEMLSELSIYVDEDGNLVY